MFPKCLQKGSLTGMYWVSSTEAIFRLPRVVPQFPSLLGLSLSRVASGYLKHLNFHPRDDSPFYHVSFNTGSIESTET